MWECERLLEGGCCQVTSVWRFLSLSLSCDSATPLFLHPRGLGTTNCITSLHLSVSFFLLTSSHLGSMEERWTGWELGWVQVRKLAPSITWSLHQWKRGLRSRRKDRRHTCVQKANILWVLGALPLCPIISGVLLQLQLYRAGMIPMSFSAIHGVCLTASLSGKKKPPPIDQGRWQLSWVSTVRLKTTHVHLVRFKLVSWDNITMNCRPWTISKEWVSLTACAFPQHFLKIFIQ